MITLNEIHDGLQQQGYFSSDDIDMALFVALTQKKPLLVEGSPGVGKTALAKAVADMLGFEFLRVQMYEGLTDDKILYDYNYQKQLLTIEMIRPALEKELGTEGVSGAVKKANEKIADFYGSSYLIERPVLKSIRGRKRTVLLIDEIDKAPEEIEYMLFEFLEKFSLSIPELGQVACKEGKEPVVFLTSNGYRELSMPLKRRCAYLFIEDKGIDEYLAILKARVPIDDSLATGIARCLVELRKYDLKQAPSVAEGIEWASLLASNPALTQEFVLHSLSLIVKDHRDTETVKMVVQNAKLWD